MKIFLSMIGVMSEVGIFSIIWLLLWVGTEFDVIRMLALDLMITILVSVCIFAKINEITGGKEDEQIYEI